MTDNSTPTAAEYLDEASRWNVGAGILTMALAPFAIPGIVLLAVLALPCLAMCHVAPLLVGLVVLPLRLGRALRARRREAQKPATERVAIPTWRLRHREGTPAGWPVASARTLAAAASRASASRPKFRAHVTLPLRTLLTCHTTSSKGTPLSAP